MALRTEERRAATVKRDAFMGDLEDLWGKLDQVLNSLGTADWARKHGKDWSMTDLPYHLGYFDRDMVAGPILRGPDLPASEQVPVAGGAAVDAWNAPYFQTEKRPQTPKEALSQMRSSRDLVRRLVASRDDEDLARSVFVPLLGWVTVLNALETCYAHTWRHFEEVKLILKRDTPRLTPEQTHLGLASLLSGFPAAMERPAAAALTAPFTLQMAFTGPGGGSWTMRVEQGEAIVTEGTAPKPDLTITQAPETFVRTIAQLHNPMVAILTGKMKVRGMRRMGTFAKLFPPPGRS